MLALTVLPGSPNSARLEEVPEPDSAAGPVLIEAYRLGVCGTDREILAGSYGASPVGQTRLVLGHESLGRVLEAPADSGLAPGDWVCSIVRHPDPEPCPSCAVGEWDMCQNGRYTEHGIKGLHGFAAERYRMQREFVVPVDAGLAERGVLIEPASVVAKAWEHIERIGKRAHWSPRSVLVAGAGPIGLLTALFGVQRGLEIHVLDRAIDGPKPELVRALGATYHCHGIHEIAPTDIVLECTGAPSLVIDCMRAARANGIVCLAGVSSGGRTIPVDTGSLNRELVLENKVVFGSVNANHLHYRLAMQALARADARWLDRLITRRVPLRQWHTAFQREPKDIKTVITFE